MHFPCGNFRDVLTAQWKLALDLRRNSYLLNIQWMIFLILPNTSKLVSYQKQNVFVSQEISWLHVGWAFINHSPLLVTLNHNPTGCNVHEVVHLSKHVRHDRNTFSVEQLPLLMADEEDSVLFFVISYPTEMHPLPWVTNNSRFWSNPISCTLHMRLSVMD